MSWLRTGPTRELCGKEPSQKKELFRNGGNFTLDRCLSMGDPNRNKIPEALNLKILKSTTLGGLVRQAASPRKFALVARYP
ncbi:MAG: hypothetical protein ABSF90_26425, partial [Syntrophobacteraceae bacterium]|jgi:hypothetical protein